MVIIMVMMIMVIYIHGLVETKPGPQHGRDGETHSGFWRGIEKKIVRE
jgi:hypothetical protein